jgi:Terminase large subunit, T4likevirus-type, N-terminal
MDPEETISLKEVTDYAWYHGELGWKLHETQKKIHRDAKHLSADENLILASRQLGKSYWGNVFALEHCLKNPGSIVRVMASTLKQIQDIVQDNLGPITVDAPQGLIERHKTSYRWRVGESELRLGPLERAHVDYNRGGNASLIIAEEGGFVGSDDYEYAVKSVIGPQLLRSGGKLIHVTTPSMDPLHYIHTEVFPKTMLTGSCSRYTIYDNPQITPEQIQRAMDLCGGPDSPSWRREYLAEIIRDPSLVIIPQFSKARHVINFGIPPHIKWAISIDWGGVKDKTVGLLMGYDFLRNKILVDEEFMHEPNTETSRIVETARGVEKRYPGEPIARWADVPGQLQVDLNKGGYGVTVPFKSDWQAGINNLQVIFARNEIEINPRCEFLIQSLESGLFNKNKTDFHRSDILGHCDALAALMYGARCIDKSSPYPDLGFPRSGMMFGRNREDKMSGIARAVQPKTFGTLRR